MENGSGTSFFFQPFFIGLYIGLILCIIVFIRSKLDNRKLKREIKNLKKHLHTKLDIDSEANEYIKQALESLKKENENLRISLQALYQKPGRREIRELHIYHKAAEILFEKAPGFAPSWQMALREAEADIKKTDTGIIPLVRKFFAGSHTAPQLERGKPAAKDELEDQ